MKIIAIKSGDLSAVSLDSLVGPVTRGIVGIMNRFTPPYKTL